MIKLFLNTYGIDKPGLISDISQLIFSVNGNIIESKMVRVENIFTIVISCEIPPKNKSLLQDKIKSIKDLHTTIDTLDSFIKNSDYKEYKFSLECLDSEGIINHFTTFFSLQNINVDEMNTTTTNAPITGSILFNLDAVLSIPQNVSKDELINSLNILSEKYTVKYDLLLFKPE